MESIILGVGIVTLTVGLPSLALALLEMWETWDPSKPRLSLLWSFANTGASNSDFVSNRRSEGLLFVSYGAYVHLRRSFV